MLKIRTLEQSDLGPLKAFTDREIGAGYYSETELSDIFRRSSKSGVMCSLLLCAADGRIEGVRFSFPPGNWSHGKGQGLNPEKWPHGLNETAYFQSLFLSANVQGHGWGGKISSASIEILKRAGAKGIACHSWKQSPHGSSTRYLQKLGFKKVAEHAEYWKEVNYNCTICLTPPCRCTAEEMYLDLEEKNA